MSQLQQWIRFAESGNQQRLTLRDGRVLRGWIVEIDDGSLVLSTGEGERGHDVTLAWQDIDPAGLAYWDARLQQWQVFSGLQEL